jgi:hypothetical protein
MNSSFVQLKEKMLSTNYPKWRNVASTTFLVITCVGVVGSFFYLYMTNNGLHCYTGYIGFSIVWLIVELITIAYLFFWTNIPQFARDVVKLNIAFANIWFGLFIFSIKVCAQ